MHFLLLATHFRSLQGEPVSAAVDWAAPACLRSTCHQSAGGRKLSRTAQGESVAGRFDMRGSRLELAHAIDLSVHAFQRGGEHLLALQGVLGCARKACASLRPFSAHCTAFFARQGALPIAHLAQTLA